MKTHTLKNFSRALLLAAMLVFSSSASAIDWIFDHAKDGNKDINMSWTDSIGSESKEGYWYYLDANNEKVYMKGSYSSTDSFTIGDEEGYMSGDTKKYANINIVIDSNISIGNLNITGNSWNNSTRFSCDSKLAADLTMVINGDLHRSTVAEMGFINTLNYVVKGNIIIDKSNLASTSYGLFVDGDVKTDLNKGPFSNFYLLVNGSVAARNKAGTDTFENGLLNPDVIIKGIVTDACTLYSKADIYDSYIQIGGVSNNAAIKRQAQTNALKGTTSYIILKNTAEYSTGGTTDEADGSLSFVMNGSAAGVQSFTSNSMNFRGGVKAMSGAFYINFAQSAGYTYFRDTAKKITVKAFTDTTASTATTISHGNLEMLGGVFGATAGYGSFRMTNIVYTAGTISLRLTSASQSDSIDLTSYYNRVQDSSTGELVTTWEKVNGGTILKTDGAGKVTFNFGDTLAWLIDDGSGSFSINGGLGVKIISWDIDNKTTLSSSDFVANLFENDKGIFGAEFTVGDDGLYVKYVAVPEASTLAAMFGVLAFCFALYRRRR